MLKFKFSKVLVLQILDLQEFAQSSAFDLPSPLSSVRVSFSIEGVAKMLLNLPKCT